MTETDARHLRRMLDCISAMRTGKLSLVQGSSELLALRDALEDFDAFGQEWFDGFTSHLVTLESAGIAPNGTILSPGAPLQPHVKSALDHIGLMVGQHIPKEDTAQG
jgi:hypothetical protein